MFSFKIFNVPLFVSYAIDKFFFGGMKNIADKRQQKTDDDRISIICYINYERK